MFCLYTLPLAKPAQAKIQMLTAICSIVKIPWNTVIWVIFNMMLHVATMQTLKKVFNILKFPACIVHTIE